MVDLFLIGASGLAREVLALLAGANDARTIALLDDDSERWGSQLDGVPVLGGLDTVVHYPEAAVLLCVGQGTTRARLADRLLALGVGRSRYISVVHSSVEVPGNCRIDRGCIVLAGAVFTADVDLGAHVVVMPHVTLTHGNRVGSFATLCAAVTLGGDVSIGEGAYLGMSSTVRQRQSIGVGAVIGMGSVVVSDVPADETWIGVPARLLRIGTAA